MAAAIAGILLISLGANGICYAQTGKNVLEMFAALYNTDNIDTSSENYTAIAEGAKESGESISNQNTRFTLEYYFYDNKNGESFFAMRTDSLDGTPLDMENVFAHYSIGVEGGSGSSSVWSEPVYNESNNSALVYYHTMLDADESGTFPKHLDLTVTHVVGDDSQEIEYDVSYETKDIGTIIMMPTGEMKARYVDCSALTYCTSKARITGGGISLTFDDMYSYMDRLPFVEIEMADGTAYWIGEKPLSTKKGPVYDANGKLKNPEDFTPEEAEELSTYTSPQERKLPENVQKIAGNYGFSDNNYSANFNNFINVDDVVAVYIDGVKMQLE